MRSVVRAALVLISAGTSGAAAHAGEAATAEKVPRLPSQFAEPGLTFGRSDELPLPKTLLYSAGPDQVIADAEQWKRRGIDGFFLGGCVGGWQSDVWSTDGKPSTIGESDATFQKAKRANEVCRRIGAETFLLISFHRFFEWFNDTSWQHVEHKFRQFAIFARDAGCKGLAFDIEYVSDQYLFEWKGYDYKGYTRADLVGKIRSRMTRVAEAMYDAFPDMVLLTLPGFDFKLGTHIQLAWIEEAARRNAPGGVHYCIGYTYRNHNIRYMLGWAWLDNVLMRKRLSKQAWAYWQRQCSIGPGVWPFGLPDYLGHGPELTPEDFRHGMAGTLMMTRRYNWVFGGDCQAQLMGRNMKKYRRKEDVGDYVRVMAEKQVVTTPKYVALAKEIREMKLRDYSRDLGLVIDIQLVGPDDYGMADLVPLGSTDTRQQDVFLQAAMDRFFGRAVNLGQRFETQTHWMLVGPFPNEGADFRGHHTVYPPERSIDLDAECDGVGGKVRWIEHRRADGFMSVDLTKVFKPTEQMCAYALCYVSSPTAVDARIRLGTNDAGKLWLGGKLVFDHPHEGGAVLDRHVVPVTLPQGTTPILLKVSNGELNWGFVFRITDADGRPLKGLRFSATPPT